MLPKKFRWKDFGDRNDSTLQNIFKNNDFIYQNIFNKKRFESNIFQNSLFGVKDLDIKLFDFLDLLTMNSLSLTNHYFNDLFFNDVIWIKKILQDFPCLEIKDVKENLNNTSYFQYYVFVSHLFLESNLSYISARAQEWNREDLIKILDWKNAEHVFFEKIGDTERYKKKTGGYEGKYVSGNILLHKKNNHTHGLYKVKNDWKRTIISVEYDDDGYIRESFNMYIFKNNTPHKLDAVIEFLTLMKEDISTFEYENSNSLFVKKNKKYKKGIKIFKNFIYSNKLLKRINMYQLLSPSRFIKLFREEFIIDFVRDVDFYGAKRDLLSNSKVEQSLLMGYQELKRLYDNDQEKPKYRYTTRYINNDLLHTEIDIEYHYREFLKAPLEYITKLVEEFKNDILFTLLNYLTEGIELERLNKIDLKSTKIFETINITAAKTGNIQAFENNFAKNHDQALYISTEHGQIKMMRYILETGKYNKINERLLYCAGRSGSIKLVKNIFKNLVNKLNDENMHYIIEGSTKKDNLELFKYLSTLKTKIFYNYITEICCKKYNKKIINYLISQNLFDFEGGLAGATRGRNRDLIEYCIENGAEDFESAFISAVEKQDLELIKFFVSKGAKNIDEALDHYSNEKITEYLESLKSEEEIFEIRISELFKNE